MPRRSLTAWDRREPAADRFRIYSPAEMPAIKIVHLHTPTPFTEYGVKGMGEGGAIAPPAAIANAVNDALRALGVELMQSPITPHRIVEAILDKSGTERMSA